jgi:protocatechuate 3,4-dioxygenase alpha subunit
VALKYTPSQTVGPYFSMCLGGPGQNVLVPASEESRIRIVGSVYDAGGEPIDDALVELWQANRYGRYRHPADRREVLALTPGFTGFGRSGVDPVTLEFSFDTVKPGRVPAPDATLQAPHVCLVIQGRGMLRPSWTRLYFDDETEANAEDFVLKRVPAARRHLLVARRQSDVTPTYRFDVRFQGPDETVFFEL